MTEISTGSRSSIRILILTQWFTPEPTLRGIEFAREFAERGHEVRVVTGFPNYPGGEVYPGYRVRVFQRERIDGITVFRLPLYPSHDGSARRRALNYISFALSSMIAAPFVGRGVDVAYVYHPPATIGLPALALKVLRRVPFVLDIQDLWPDTLSSTDMVADRRILRAVGRWMSVLYRSAGRIVVLSPGFKAKLVERGVPSDKIQVTYNWAPQIDVEETGSEQSWRSVFAGHFNVVFAGTMGKAQALGRVLEATALIEDSEHDVQFVFIGGGVEVAGLESAAREAKLSNVVFLPRMTFDEISSALKAADLLLVHLRDDPLFTITIPSKTQAYLAIGTPILMAVRGDAADLIERAKAGLTCNPEDPEAIADAVVQICRQPAHERDEMGRRGRAFYKESLSLTVAVDQIERCLANAAGDADRVPIRTRMVEALVGIRNPSDSPRRSSQGST